MPLRHAGKHRRWAALVAAYAMLLQVLAATLAPLAQARQAETAVLGAVLCHVDASTAGQGQPADIPGATHDCCLAGVCAMGAAPLRAEPLLAPTTPTGHVAAIFTPPGLRIFSAPERDALRPRGPPVFS